MQSDRVIPESDPGVLPIARLDELHTHIAALDRDPDTAIDAQLLDEVELQLTDANIPPLLPTVLVPLTRILRATSAPDPSPLLSLTTRLLAPLPLTRILALADPPSVLAALRSPLPGANRLGLAVLAKAARAPADAALLATALPELPEALLVRWLDAPDVGVGERAGRVLGDLLETDCDVVVAPAAVNGAAAAVAVAGRVTGHGRLWRLLFEEEQLLAVIPRLCSPDAAAATADGEQGPPSPPPRTERQVSLAQGRLLRLLPRLARLNLGALTRTPFPELLPLPRSVARDAGGHGLLQWAALAMVDKSDMLMHLSLIDFFETLVSVMRMSPSATSTVRSLVRAATANDAQLKEALLALPNRTVEEEAEPLRIYIRELLD